MLKIQENWENEPPTEDNARRRGRRRCVIFTDANGQGATPNSVKNHVPREQREECEVEVVVTFTLDASNRKAWRCMEQK